VTGWLIWEAWIGLAPVRLQTPAEVGGEGSRLWLLPLIAGIALLFVAGWMWWRFVSGRGQEDAETRAFRRLCRGARLSGRERALALRLGEAIGASPVVVLVSHAAYRHAAQRAANLPAAPPAGDADRLEERLFLPAGV
jgi:hypothetical protein